MSVDYRTERRIMMLYPLTIAVGLALLAGANLVTHPGGRTAVFACSFASFLIAALAVAGLFP